MTGFADYLIVSHEGHIEAKQIHLIKSLRHFTTEDWEKMKLNEPGGQKLDTEFLAVGEGRKATL